MVRGAPGLATPRLRRGAGGTRLCDHPTCNQAWPCVLHGTAQAGQRMVGAGTGFSVGMTVISVSTETPFEPGTRLVVRAAQRRSSQWGGPAYAFEGQSGLWPARLFEPASCDRCGYLVCAPSCKPQETLREALVRGKTLLAREVHVECEGGWRGCSHVGKYHVFLIPRGYRVTAETKAVTRARDSWHHNVHDGSRVEAEAYAERLLAEGQ